MGNNELVLLDQVLEQRRAERSTPIADDDAFELFACEQALRDRDLSAEEVAEGIVGGGNDGGLDGVYVFLADVLLSEDSDVFQVDFTGARCRHARDLNYGWSRRSGKRRSVRRRSKRLRTQVDDC